MGEVAQFTGGKIPQKLVDTMAGDNSDLSSGVRGGYSVLSIRGSRWHIKVGEEETTITDSETGDPVGSLKLVILKGSPNVSKNYYEGGYEEGASEAPTCWSIDGIVPDPAADKQADACAACPKNQFGSRITDAGKKVKACSDSRRVAVAPEGDFENKLYGGPMLLRIPASSLSNLSAFGKKMSARGFPYNTIVTRLNFDHSVSFPKLEFNAVRPLSDDEADVIIKLLNDHEYADKIEAILAKDLEVVPQGEAAPPVQEQLFEEAPEVQPKTADKAPAQEPTKPEVQTTPETPQKAKVETKDESDDALDDELKDILSSLDNLD